MTTMTKLQYRGVATTPPPTNSRPPPPLSTLTGASTSRPSPPEAAAVDTAVDLQYRGHHYHHRLAEAASQVNQG